MDKPYQDNCTHKEKKQKTEHTPGSQQSAKVVVVQFGITPQDSIKVNSDTLINWALQDSDDELEPSGTIADTY